MTVKLTEEPNQQAFAGVYVVALVLDSQYCLQYWLIKGRYSTAIFHADRNSGLIDTDRPVL